MKAFFVVIILFLNYHLIGQVASVSADKENVLYLEVDNPLTIAVENTSSRVLVVKSDNGIIIGSNGLYNCRPKSLGKANIAIFVKMNGKLKLVKNSAFRVKYVGDASNIIFYIGHCSDECTISKSLLKAQQYVRAQLIGTDINAVFPIDSFDVRIFGKTYVETKHNIGNEINVDLKAAFEILESGDLLVFKNIYSHRQNGSVYQLNPIAVRIID